MDGYIKCSTKSKRIWLFKGPLGEPSAVNVEGNGNPLQYSCLENPMDRGPMGSQESNTTEWLNHHHHQKKQGCSWHWGDEHDLDSHGSHLEGKCGAMEWEVLYIMFLAWLNIQYVNLGWHLLLKDSILSRWYFFKGEPSSTSIRFVLVQSPSHVQLWNPMDCNMPGLLVLHYPLEFAQMHVRWVSNAI